MRYGLRMSRQADPDKKPELLEQVLDYLLDKPLSALTFRHLAASLNVSTFTLVYHFGTRADLVREIIRAIATRQRGFESLPDPDIITVDSYLAGLRHTFELTLLPRNRALQRLEFEAQMLEALETAPGVTRMAHRELQTRGTQSLVGLGLNKKDAAIESGLLVDTFYGIQVGLVVNDDSKRARAAFDRALQQHRARIETLDAERD
jgi:AcrR family transcriptional regulator